MKTVRRSVCILGLLLAACAAHVPPAAVPPGAVVPPGDTGLLGVSAEQLNAAHWIARQPDAHRVRLNAAAVDAFNARMHALDPTVHTLADLPIELPGGEVTAMIRALSSPPARALFDDRGQAVPAERVLGLVEASAIETVPDTVVPRFALVTRRADLRTFPTAMRVFGTPDDTDIDRFQESALFPGTAVAVLHTSHDGAWSFVVSEVYHAWVDTHALAHGERDVVLDYATRAPFLVITGATARTVFTRARPALSDLPLDMGVRLPWRHDWPADVPVDGQHPGGAYVVELPVRRADGTLVLAPTLLPRSADVSIGHMPLTEAHLLRQAFKFLGERYGWGHADGTRDCSGFVSEIYRAFGLVLPRNTGDQARSPALDRIAFAPGDGLERRRARLRDLDVGDLVYIPGHVMLVIGHTRDATFVIHDVAGVHLRDPAGRNVRVPINSVAVTPLESLLGDDGRPLIERITAVQRVRAPAES